MHRRWNELIEEVLKAAQACGDIRKDLDITRVAVWLGGAFLGVQYQSGILAAAEGRNVTFRSFYGSNVTLPPSSPEHNRRTCDSGR